MIMTRGAAKQTGAIVPEVHGANKPLDPDLNPEKDKGLQKQVFTQPANVKPSGPVAIATGPAPPTPYLPRAVPEINLPIKVMPATPLTPPRIPVQTPPRISRTPVQIRPTNLPLSTPATVPRTRPRQPIFMTPIKRENVPIAPRKQLFTPQQQTIQSPVQEHFQHTWVENHYIWVKNISKNLTDQNITNVNTINEPQLFCFSEYSFQYFQPFFSNISVISQ